MQDVIVVVLLFAPLIFFLWLANLAERKRTVPGEASYSGDVSQSSGTSSHYAEQPSNTLGIVTLTLLGLFYALFLMFGLLLQAMGLLAQGPLARDMGNVLAGTPFDAAALSRMGLTMWVSALLGILLLIGPIRRVLARVLPFDPANNVHAVALSYSALLLMNLLVTLALGLRHLAQLMEASATNYNPAPGIWAQDITWVLMALVGVGWLSRRGFRSSLRHLGIVLWVPLVVDFVSWLLRRDIRAALERSGFGLLQVRHLVLGIGTGLLLVPAILAIEWLTRQAGVPSDTDVERLTEQMVGPLLRSLPGIITLGVAAALGEESIFRGALQPRFGLVFTSLLFALTHSNYGISVSTLLVFIVGLVLGLVRIRANTSTSMIVHAVYNMSLGLISYLGLMQNF